mmetsp:Transcript_16887/g.38592  ORF Transcript_16887/g.38592 Transcript_16887/m.38592 type:complete len:209 (-) Transcript_16887:414-1040(-)
MGPTNWFPYISKFSSPLSFPIPSGIVPLTRVLERSNSFSCVIFSSDDGTVPVKAFMLRCSFSIVVNSNTSSGMVPLNLHPPMLRYFKLVKRPISLGNWPVIIGQLLISRYFICVNTPISVGSVPRRNCRRFIVRIPSRVSLDISAGIPLHSSAGAAFRSLVLHNEASVRSILATLSSTQTTPLRSHLCTDGSPQLSNCSPQFFPIVYA